MTVRLSRKHLVLRQLSGALPPPGAHKLSVATISNARSGVLQRPTSSISTTTMSIRNTRNYGFLPIPKRLQYDPERPFEFTTLLNVVFGFASTMVVRPQMHPSKICMETYYYAGCKFVLRATTIGYVCSVYLALVMIFESTVELAKSFNVSDTKVANIPTLTQAG